VAKIVHGHLASGGSEPAGPAVRRRDSWEGDAGLKTQASNDGQTGRGFSARKIAYDLR
jgi:hypothetical protein